MTTTTAETSRPTRPDSIAVTFEDAHQLQKAMAAAQPIVTSTNGGSRLNSCRLVVERGRGEVLATDGHRMLRVTVDEVRTSEPVVDTAVPVPIVQTIAQWRARGLIVTLRPSGVTVTDRAGASENGPFAEPNGFDSAIMRRILDDTGVRIEQATFGRRAALAAIRAMPDQSKMLRLMIGDGGLDMWATATETIGPNDQPHAHQGTETGERTHGPFGASRQHLLEALRTLQARELTIKLQPGRKTPLRLESPDTGETLLIMLAALQ